MAMERSTDTCNASPAIRKNTSFLTPCRRMGLARKSPASSGSWHANKLPLTPSPRTNSPYKSPVKVSDEDCSDNMHTEHEIQNYVTPSRNIKILPRRQLTKRLKTSHSLHSPRCSKGDTDSSVSNKSEANEVLDDLITKKNLTEQKTLWPDSDSEDEIILPAETITEEAIKDVQNRIKKKEEKLKDLKLAQLYKRKHDVTTLQKLVQTWLEGCQTALQDLQSLLQDRGHQLTIEDLLNKLNIPHQLVKYKVDLEDFE